MMILRDLRSTEISAVESADNHRVEGYSIAQNDLDHELLAYAENGIFQDPAPLADLANHTRFSQSVKDSPNQCTNHSCHICKTLGFS